MNNKKGFILSTYVYMLLVFFLLLLTTMLSVMNNTKLLSNKLKEQSSNTSGLSDKDFSFVLLGEGDMIIKKGEEYIEPGFKIQTSKKKDLSDIVNIIGNVDVNNPNTYKLTYSATYNGITKKLTRNVTVLDNIASNYITGLYNYRKDENGLIIDTTVDKNIRYAGSNPSNKVYFNCKDKDSNKVSYGETNYDYASSCEVWRIIGVFDVDNGSGKVEKRVKLVRDALAVNMSFDSSTSDVNSGYGINEWGKSTYTDGSTYEGADLMRMLNGYYIGKDSTCTYCNDTNQETCENDCTSSVTPLSSTSLRMVEDALWYTGAQRWLELLPLSTMYASERGTQSGKICTATSTYEGRYQCTDTVNRRTEWLGKIGLIYPSDYAYASNDNNCFNNIRGEDSACQNNNWLHPSNSWYWTISPFTDSYYATNPFLVSSTQNVYANAAFINAGVRPSLYLKSSVKITSGNGTQEKPYKLGI